MGKFRWFPQSFKGGILITAIGLLLIVSTLFYSSIENRQLSAEMAHRTQRAHQVQILQQIFWHQYEKIPSDKRPSKGEMVFNIGEIKFETIQEMKEEVFKVTVIIEGQRYPQKYPTSFLFNLPSVKSRIPGF